MKKAVTLAGYGFERLNGNSVNVDQKGFGALIHSLSLCPVTLHTFVETGSFPFFYDGDTHGKIVILTIIIVTE
jgi:hypothetical protein